ncbi:helix-turn-helix transcriptional regulator [Nocardia sp. CDC159]|uniref:HTH-type transcriptional regulator RipA n=1 Tax=Nocardia pulmonis TaxID=2951408 RepID=A0A9X2E626_9NOCA|nr:MULTISPECIES: helix-turn-helix transcriptional regulator [Nocardia]MCM6774336.1 helix-turn-helix transcriptional regulator [Nocardia pulmonis]MCM6787598.1 helix-turn-helix transcriptional regulator [Nocardia sp. CDC159]
MSPNGHAPLLPATTGPTAMVLGASTLPAGHWFDTHRHPQHQIVWASRGVLGVEVGGSWVLPPTRALWVPATTPHRTGAAARADMRGIFIEPDLCPITFPTPTLLRVGRLLHELFDYLTAGSVHPAAVQETPSPATEFSVDTTAADRRRRAEAVVFDLVEPVEVIPVGAPMPADPRARAVAEALLRDPADDRTLEQFAPVAAASPRTLARLFLAETAIGFGQWRTQIRLAASLPLLADGLPLSRIAERVGYATASAYVAAFRRAVGISPGRYFAR